MKKRRTRSRRRPVTALPAAPDNAVVVEALPPRLMSVNAACSVLGLGRWKTYQLIRKGRITGVKLDGKTMVEIASVDRFFESLPRLEQRP